MKNFRIFANISHTVPGEKTSLTPLEQFENLYFETRPLVSKAIFSITRESGSEDLIQETYAKAWEKFDSFRNDSLFSTWIYKIAINTALEHIRKIQKERARTGFIEFDLDSIASRELNPDQKLLLSEAFRVAFLKMKKKHLEVFLLFFQLEHSIKEISQLLDLSEGTVKSRIHYSKLAFTQTIEKFGVRNGR